MPEPTLPTEEDIAKLPRWARVAFAARCARRALLPFVASPRSKSFSTAQREVEAAERSASKGQTETRVPTSDDPICYSKNSVAEYALAASYAAAVAFRPDAIAFADRAAYYSAEAGVPVDSIVADFRLLMRLAVRDRWDDDTPVTTAVFEPSGSAPSAAAPPAAVTATGRTRDEARCECDIGLESAFPGEYVAFRERWEHPTLSRTILAHDKSLKTVHDALAHLKEAEIEAVRVTYCYPPGRPFRGPSRIRLSAPTNADRATDRSDTAS